MRRTSGTWIGGGIVAALTTPFVASVGLALAHALGAPTGELEELPTMMIILWGPILSSIACSPLAFVFGAVAARRVERQLAGGNKSTSMVLWESAGWLGAIGFACGALLTRTGVLDWQIGWILLPIGAMAGTVSGVLAGSAVVADDQDAA